MPWGLLKKAKGAASSAAEAASEAANTVGNATAIVAAAAAEQANQAANAIYGETGDLVEAVNMGAQAAAYTATNIIYTEPIIRDLDDLPNIDLSDLAREAGAAAIEHMIDGLDDTGRAMNAAWDAGANVVNAIDASAHAVFNLAEAGLGGVDLIKKDLVIAGHDLLDPLVIDGIGLAQDVTSWSMETVAQGLRQGAENAGLNDTATAWLNDSADKWDDRAETVANTPLEEFYAEKQKEAQLQRKRDRYDRLYAAQADMDTFAAQVVRAGAEGTALLPNVGNAFIQTASVNPIFAPPGGWFDAFALEVDEQAEMGTDAIYEEAAGIIDRDFPNQEVEATDQLAVAAGTLATGSGVVDDVGRLLIGGKNVSGATGGRIVGQVANRATGDDSVSEMLRKRQDSNILERASSADIWEDWFS